MPIDETASTPTASGPVRAARAGLGSHRYLTLFEQLTPLFGCHCIDDISLRACQLVADLLDVSACSLLLLNPQKTGLQLTASTHIPREEWNKVCLPLDEGICGKVFTAGEALMVRGSAQFRRRFGRDSQARYTAPSCVVAPLMICGTPSGVINVANPRNRRTFSQRDVNLIRSAADMISGTLAHALQSRETQRLHEHMSMILATMLVGIVSVSADMRVRNLNDQARALLGLGEAKLTDKPLKEAMPLPIYNAIRRLIKRLDQQSQPVQDRLHLEREVGPQWLELTLTRMRQPGELNQDYLVMIQDVGQDEEIRRLRESENMKRNFLAIISHELRTPLTVLRGAIPIIDPDAGCEVTTETLRQFRRILGRNCQRLTDVVNTILDVTEIENGTLQLSMRTVDLNAMLNELVQWHAEGAQMKRLTWDCRLEERLAPIPADERRLRQVLSELIANAIKFSHAGQPLGIETRLTESFAEVWITNNGEAIGPENRAHIFEKFYQSNSSSTRTAGGCGLGLFLAHNIIGLHGGSVELADSPPTQTTFVVRLPLEAAAPAGATNE